MEAEIPLIVKQRLDASVRYVVNNFMEDKQYETLNKKITSKNNKYHAFSAATKLMEEYGVNLSSQDQQSMDNMDEMSMIDSIVSKMPKQSKDEFQSFFLKLQMIVTTATRLRTALQEGRSDLVHDVLDDAEKTSISKYILRMAVAQAAAEVTSLKQQHELWVRQTEREMSKVVHGQGDAIHARKALAAAQAKLAQLQMCSNDKAKRVIMGFMSGNAQAVQALAFGSWKAHTKQMKAEGDIRREYEDRINAAEQRLFDYKGKQLESVRKVMHGKAAEREGMLVRECFDVFKEDLEEQRRNVMLEDQVRELEERILNASNTQADKARQVVERMNAGSLEGLLNLCFMAWLDFSDEYNKDREMEDAIKKAEQGLEKMKSKGTAAQGILSKMGNASDTGLLTSVLQGWTQIVQEEKKANEMAEMLEQQRSKTSAFGARAQGGARSLCERAAQHQQTMFLLKVFGNWKLDAHMDRMIRGYQYGIEGKKSQLVNVQQMFRKFATQLESGLRGDKDTEFDMNKGAKHKPRKGGMDKKAEGSVSLPDIHSKHGASPPRPHSREGSQWSVPQQRDGFR